MTGKRPRWKRRGCVLFLFVGLLLLIVRPLIVREVGGAFDHRPEEMEQGLSPGARALLDAALEGARADRLLDYHVHLVGLGRGGTGCYVNESLRSWWHLTNRVRFDVYQSASGITDPDRADAQYVERLVALIRHIPRHGKHVLLAFDRAYTEDGAVDEKRTQFFVPNDYVFAVAERYPDVFVPAISVHPYREDALAELAKGRDRGARIVKWLPNAQGIDPLHAKCAPFYDRMRELGLILLTHAGEEQAVHSAGAQELGNPLRLRRALDAGVTVIVAHCASLGEADDLDHPGTRRSALELFLRLMEEKKYEGLLFGEISGLTQFNRLPEALETVLRRADLFPRLVNGSDYPIPAINILVRTRELVARGYITEEQRAFLNEIYDYNPLLFDFVAKRTIRLPGKKTGFPMSVFERHEKLQPR